MLKWKNSSASLMMLYCSSTLHLQLLRANSNLSVREKCKEKKNEKNHHSKLPKPRSESTFPLHTGEKQLNRTLQGTVQAGGEEKALAPHWDFRKSAGRTQVEEWAGASTPRSFPAPLQPPPSSSRGSGIGRHRDCAELKPPVFAPSQAAF